MKYRFWAVAVLAVVVNLAHAETTLRFAPEVGQKWNEKLTGQLIDVAVQGQSLGVDGKAAAGVAAAVTGKGQEPETVCLSLQVSDVKSQLNGQPATPTPPSPLLVQVDKLGAMCLAGEQGTTGGVNFMETGGIPLQIINVLAHTIRFQEAAVSKDDEWTIEDHYTFPGLGEVPINTRWKLAAQNGNLAQVSSSAIAALPDFKAPNPIVPGTEMDVRGARVTITEMRQDYDTTLSRVVKTEGKLRIDAKVDMQGMQMPLTLSLSFALDPVAGAQEPAR